MGVKFVEWIIRCRRPAVCVIYICKGYSWLAPVWSCELNAHLESELISCALTGQYRLTIQGHQERTEVELSENTLRW